ncbi:hypothetical protein ACFZDG_20110 [Kitasatospora xanthocidica]|uniref:hypothetical protein n=1 Tax=Kitasatospora xanthocidica TaxID=83382 RepID=UPI0036E10591
MAPTDLLPTDTEESTMRSTRTSAASLSAAAVALVAGLLLALGGPAHSAPRTLSDAVVTTPVTVPTPTPTATSEEPWN